MGSEELLAIEDVSVSFDIGRESVEVVSGVSLSIARGRTLALVGESGCGKTVTASAVMRLLPHPHGTVTAGKIRFGGLDVLDLPLARMHELRGGRMSMIFQEPMTALNPVHRSGDQIREVLDLHRADLDAKSKSAEVLALLDKVEMPSPELRAKAYPFQLSGGMRQRVMIAMALAGEPELLIADEPTTALDVTVQAQILELIRGLQRKNGMAVLYITHDMGVVAQIADEVAVMYAGQIVERASAADVFASPLHPYTRGLIGSMPSLESKPKSRLPSIQGQVPSPANYPATCRFAERCAHADSGCRAAAPELKEYSPGRLVRCFKAGTI
jgi:peptide/nickel transport system ATP-binding protein